MNEGRWDNLIDLIDDRFGVDRHAKTEEDVEDAPGLKRQIHAVYFTKDNKSYKVERITSPAVLDTKTHYVHRGAAQRVEHIYDPHETVSRVAYQRQNASGDWKEIGLEDLL